MQKIIFIFVMAAFSIMGCMDKASEDDLSAKCKSATMQEVVAMATHYNEVIKKDPSKGIQQISMDSKVFGNLINNTSEFKLIAVADLKTDEISMYIQLHKMDESYIYCDINSYATASRPKPFCPPPPGCDTTRWETPAKKLK